MGGGWERDSHTSIQIFDDSITIFNTAHGYKCKSSALSSIPVIKNLIPFEMIRDSRNNNLMRKYALGELVQNKD